MESAGERPVNRALLVHIQSQRADGQEDPDEFYELALSAGAEIAGFFRVSRSQPTARFLIGTGKVEELAGEVERLEAGLVIFNQMLTPSQERNLERALGCRVLDRIGLILDIFAMRARTHEGKLQVELAQLEHISTRLVHSRTGLSRQQGGIGLRGPGETRLETDRRLLRIRMRQLRARLEKVRNQRGLARRGRSRAEVPGLSLVGYTNAGKSTLFNALTAASVYAADQLFATLDPTVRRLEVPRLGAVTLADTVGFIRHLPHQLVEAFHATLEETTGADLLLHVVDASAGERDGQMEQVQAVLQEIGAGQVPVLEVFNKIDALDAVQPQIQRDAQGLPVRVWLSARDGDGLELLLQALRERLLPELYQAHVVLPPARGRLRALLFAADAVRSEQFDSQGNSVLQLSLSLVDMKRLLGQEDMSLEVFHATFARAPDSIET